MSRGLFETRKKCDKGKHVFGDWNVMPYWDNCEPNDIDEEVAYVKYYRECSVCGYEESGLKQVSGYEEQQAKIRDFKQTQQVKQLQKVSGQLQADKK